MKFAAMAGCFMQDQLVLAWPSGHLTLVKVSDYLNKKEPVFFSKLEDCDPIRVTIVYKDVPSVSKVFSVGKWIIATSSKGEVVSVERDDQNVTKVVIRKLSLSSDEILSAAIDLFANLIIVITREGVMYRLALANFSH